MRIYYRGSVNDGGRSRLGTRPMSQDPVVHSGRPAIHSTALSNAPSLRNCGTFRTHDIPAWKRANHAGQVGEAGNEAVVYGWSARMNTCLEGTHPCRKHGTSTAMTGLDADLLSRVKGLLKSGPLGQRQAGRSSPEVVGRALDYRTGKGTASAAMNPEVGGPIFRPPPEEPGARKRAGPGVPSDASTLHAQDPLVHPGRPAIDSTALFERPSQRIYGTFRTRGKAAEVVEQYRPSRRGWERGRCAGWLAKHEHLPGGTQPGLPVARNAPRH